MFNPSSQQFSMLASSHAPWSFPELDTETSSYLQQHWQKIEIQRRKAAFLFAPERTKSLSLLFKEHKRRPGPACHNLKQIDPQSPDINFDRRNLVIVLLNGSVVPELLEALAQKRLTSHSEFPTHTAGEKENWKPRPNPRKLRRG